jgi:hypothetical protein
MDQELLSICRSVMLMRLGRNHKLANPGGLTSSHGRIGQIHSSFIVLQVGQKLRDR